jgi:SSS family solute:Na+ symporter
VAEFADHQVEFWIFALMFAVVTVMGFAAARWRRPAGGLYTLNEWGLGGRAFGNWVTWFLLSGDVYTAYTFLAVPTLVYGLGATGFFPMPFLVIVYPMLFVVLLRYWSVAHVHGFVTPAEFANARFGSRTLGLVIAITGIVATMPYIALQLVGVEAVFKVLGLPSGWPLTAAFIVLALYTFNSGLRAPALLSIVKDALVLWTVIAIFLIVVAGAGGWESVFDSGADAFEATPREDDGILLGPNNQLNYITLALGSALALFLYPHTLTAALAARNRATLRRTVTALPLYTLLLGILMMAGFAVIHTGVEPIDGDPNTVLPVWVDAHFPPWSAGLIFAAIGVGAMVPAAVMSIAAANLFTRTIYRGYLRPRASAREETNVGKVVSLTVKAGAVLVILLLDTQFAIDLQLIGGVFIMQTLPAVAIGLYTSWMHRWALIAGIVAGFATGLAMLYQIPQYGGADGTEVLRQHWGGSAWPLSNLGLDTSSTIYVGVVALAVNLTVSLLLTPILRGLAAPDGADATHPDDYVADEGDTKVRRMTEIVDGSAGGAQEQQPPELRPQPRRMPSPYVPRRQSGVPPGYR